MQLSITLFSQTVTSVSKKPRWRRPKSKHEASKRPVGEVMDVTSIIYTVYEPIRGRIDHASAIVRLSDSIRRLLGILENWAVGTTGSPSYELQVSQQYLRKDWPQ